MPAGGRLSLGAKGNCPAVGLTPRNSLEGRFTQVCPLRSPSYLDFYQYGVNRNERLVAAGVFASKMRLVSATVPSPPEAQRSRSIPAERVGSRQEHWLWPRTSSAPGTMAFSILDPVGETIRASKTVELANTEKPLSGDEN